MDSKSPSEEPPPSSVTKTEEAAPLVSKMAPAPQTTKPAASAKPHRLRELAATAICGNDITSSCLYVSAIAILYAGVWAPLALALVAGTLYLFRSVYGEVVGALPLNGGAYNALLNTTSKFRASMAACLTILSYLATAVISASEAMHYLHKLFHQLPIIPATIGLLAFFTVLTIAGISESARVAVVIFVFHITSLAVLVLASAAYMCFHGFGTLAHNFHAPLPDGFLAAVFFGFCASLLGISGFESSANYVEEQEAGVFPKTLRNMWIAVSIFNPLIAFLALVLIPITDVGTHETALLSHMGDVASGHWLKTVISVDATLVLSGAVLTCFVGINGLVERMTLDRCLPQFLLKRNRRGTTHRITIAFFLLAVSILFITEGQIKALAGVYTISFLAVMALFGGGNLLLKIKRPALPRPIRAAWITVLIAISAVVIGILGNAVKNPPYLKIFLQYFIPTALLVIVMLQRIAILKVVMHGLANINAFFKRPPGPFTWMIREKIHQITDQQMVFFTRGDNLANLNRAMLYVLVNEHTNRIKVVNVVPEGVEPPPQLEGHLKVLDEMYPEIDIDFVVLRGKFCPDLIGELSQKWNIPTNFMFIGCPAGRLPFHLADLRGVRLII